ncbi:hypothetical protein SH2C18_08320 [Clostridium sediminicola]|uniref:hypothetical protein n=1 Tax=Clostridium sediminicola TaxID=3114879 RepID=UPI0031F1FA49
MESFKIQNFTTIKNKEKVKEKENNANNINNKVKFVALNMLFFTTIVLLSSKGNLKESLSEINEPAIAAESSNELTPSTSKLDSISIVPSNLSDASDNNLNLLSTVLVPQNKEITIQVKQNSFVKYNTLPTKFRYKNINESSLRSYLRKRKSILAEEPYFSTIIDVAASYDLNPLLLFAITGQEQSFVPTTSKSHSKIANNPFNVHGSWKKYNTNINDSADIVCRTLINLSKNRPSTYDPILWINRKYAADQGWGSRVNKIFNMLANIAS